MHERQPSEPGREQENPAEAAVAAGLPPVEGAVGTARRGRLDAAGVLRLQRAIGNAAVGRILARQPGPGAGLPPLMDPNEVEDEWDRMAAEMVTIGEETGKRMIDTLTGKDRILFTSRLRALTVTERAALKDNAEFWKQLRTHLSGLAYWSVQLMLEYGGRAPHEVNALSAAIHAGDWRHARTLLMGYESLKAVPGLREVIASRFPQDQADDLRVILAESVARAESGMAHYQEAHYEGGAIKKFTGDRNYELVRTGRYLRVIVRIRLAEDAGNKKTEITDEVVARWEASIGKLWNGKFRLRSGANALDVWFVPVFVYHDDNAHHQVKVTMGGARSDEGNWHAEDAGEVAAHEFGHMLGNPDEYNLPGATAEIPAALNLTAEERRRSSWEGLTGTKKDRDTEGYDVPALMGSHYKSTAVHLRYAADIVATFNAKLKLAGEAPWTVEEQK
ncbi:MAG: hypothetical protein ABI611_03835 [Solirubrobacteraceae bacterium]